MNKTNFTISKFNPSISEWQDSIYTYNKNYLGFILYNKNKTVFKLLNNYFNLNNKYNNFISNNLKDFFIPSSISNIELKEYNNETSKYNNFININKKYELDLIKRNYFYIIKRKKALSNWKNKLILNKNYSIINRKVLSTLSLKRVFTNIPHIKHTNNVISLLIYVFNKNKAYLKNKLIKLRLIYNSNKFKEETPKNVTFLLNRKIYSDIILKRIVSLNSYEYSYYLLKNVLEKIAKNKSINVFLKRTYLANIYLNNNKFNSINLLNLKKIIYMIYEKRVKINITNIKYVYMENNIFIESITRKLNDRKKGVLRVLKKALKLVKIADINISLLLKEKRMMKYINNVINTKKYTNFIHYYSSNKYKTILRSIKNIHVIGISLEAKGRLTKRMTASRSVYKLKYKGNLKNIYSCYYQTSTHLIRGFNKSNISFVNHNSKNKNGSYGISSSLNTF